MNSTRQRQQQTSPQKQNLPPVVLSISKILLHFLSSKISSRIRQSFLKIKNISTQKKKVHKFTCYLLHNLQTKKQKEFTQIAFRRVVIWKNAEIHKQNLVNENKKMEIRKKSVGILGCLYKRIHQRRVKETFNQISTKGKMLWNVRNFKNKSIQRIFMGLTLKKIAIGFESIKSRKIVYLKKIHTIKRFERIFSFKLQSNVLHAWTKLQLNKLGQTKKQQKISSGTSPKSPPAQKSNQSGALIEKQKSLQQKNKLLEASIKQTKEQNKKVISEYKEEVSKLEEEHERLKFNSGILDEQIQGLESEIINRQKRTRKTLSNAELWDKVYSNFLFMINKYSGQTLPKEQVLNHLLTPLAPLKLDIDIIKSQNEVLTELLSQYQKFFAGTDLLPQSSQECLPYDVLVEKNKFMYAAVETLIKQGLGTEEEVKQIESDLQNISKNK